jgi:hypothetical protein
VHIRTVRNCLLLCCLFSSLAFAQNATQPDPKQAVESGTDLSNPATLGSSDAESALQDPAIASDPQGDGNSSSRSKSSPAGTTAAPNPATATPAVTPYVFPSKHEMNRWWLQHTVFGSKPYAGAAFTATWNTWVTNSPDEWGQGGKGWSQRFGSSLVDNGINTSTLVLWSRAMGQDPRYFRCECTGTWPRARHAFKMVYSARDQSGSLVFAPAKIGSPFVGPMVTRNTYYPDRFGPGNAASAGAYYLIGSVGWNLVREFITKKPIF